MKQKQFKDPVHGYIDIPKNIVEIFIDTELFQRLRRIEQTSFRCLLPAARHDRFIHSLGVYHIGKLAIESLFNNTSKEILDEVFGCDDYSSKIEEIKRSFEIACLMHDCAHSPLSHTFECYYFNQDNLKPTWFLREIDRMCNTDIASIPNTAKPHEIISCYVLIKKHYDDIKKLSANPELIVRSILGILYYKEDGSLENQFYNAVVGLLNSNSIDVDKLDYIMRDTYNSGVNNFRIDIDRFISSVIVTYHPESKEEIVLGYKKSALSVLDSIIFAKDYLGTWVISHHKVVYHSFMIKKLFQKIVENIATKKVCNKDDIINKMFDIQNFFSESLLECDNCYIKLYMLDDYDIYHFMKLLGSNEKEYDAIYKRSHHKSLWKSYSEYLGVFNKSLYDEQLKRTIVENQIKRFCRKYSFIETDFILEKTNMQDGYINPHNTYIDFNGVSKTLVSVSNKDRYQPLGKSYFYVYVPSYITEDKRVELLNLIKNNI